MRKSTTKVFLTLALLFLAVGGAKAKTTLSLPGVWDGTTQAGSTYSFGGGYNGAATWAGAWPNPTDWSGADYEYVWVKYSGFTGNIKMAIEYDEWTDHKDWGDVFLQQEVYFTEPSGVLGIAIDKTTTFVKGSAETDGEHIGEIYAKHVRQIVFQDRGTASTLTIEGLYVGTEAEYMQDYEPAFSYVVDYTTLNDYTFWHANVEKCQYTIGIEGNVLKIVNNSNKVYTESEAPYSTEEAKDNWHVQYQVAPAISTILGVDYLIKIKIKASVEGNVHWSFGNWGDGNSTSGSFGVTTEWQTVEIKTTTPHVSSFFLLQSGNLYGTIEVEKVEILINQRTIVVSSAGYATFSTDKAVDVTNIVTAYTAKYNAGKVALTPVTEIPANNAVIIEAAADVYTVPTISTASALTDNDLKVSDGTVTGNGTTIYVLANGDNGVGFYLLQNGDAIPAGKAYLEIPTNAPSYSYIGFGEGTTAIDGVRNQTKEVSGEIFDLQGRRVANPTKGLYIVNGKKVIIK